MEKQKEQVALLTGGYTEEREISIKSAMNVAEKMDRARFDVYLIYIVPEGWYYLDESEKQHPINKHDFSIRLPGRSIQFDVVFICIHGSPGENGYLQGYFELIGLSYTSCRLQTAALTMNKSLTKMAVSHISNLHVPKSIVINSKVDVQRKFHDANLRYPVFIKPNTGGSSIGMTKADNELAAVSALNVAFATDLSRQVIVEEYIEGIEYSVGAFLKDGHVLVLPPSEIITENAYFDFAAKYLSEKTTDITPARLPDESLQMLRDLVCEVFCTLDCRGVVRIDFIQERSTGKFFFLEVNTIPGQTDTSLVPKQLRSIGYDVTDFFTHLIEEAYQANQYSPAN